MSKQKKAKKLRRPNLPVAAMTSTASSGGEVARTVGAVGQTIRSETPVPAFDYTHIKRDLRRIAVLAGSLVAVMVVLSFFIK